MKIVITGGSGFIGSHLLRTLRKNYQAEYQIERLDRTATYLDMERLFASFRPDLVLHLGALFIAEHKAEDISPLIESNILFGTYLLQACVQYSVGHFIQTGTSWQYWRSEDVPVTLYAATKSAFQKILQYYTSQFSLRTYCLELYDTYGPGDSRGKIVQKLIECFDSQRAFDLSPGEQKLNLLHVDDVISAFLCAMDSLRKESPGTFRSFEVSSNHEIRLKDLIKIIELTTGCANPIRIGARPYRQREVMEPSHGRSRVPGWQERRELKMGIKELWDEYRKHR